MRRSSSTTTGLPRNAVAPTRWPLRRVATSACDVSSTIGVWQRSGSAPYGRAELEPVHDRHLEVRDDEIWTPAAGFLQRLPPIPRVLELELETHQVDAQEHEERVGVVDAQHLHVITPATLRRLRFPPCGNEPEQQT